MHRALRIDFRFETAWSESELRPLNDVEVVNCCVPAAMALCADCCAEDYELFC